MVKKEMEDNSNKKNNRLPSINDVDDEADHSPGTGLASWHGSGLANIFDDLFRPFDEMFESVFPRSMLSSLMEREGASTLRRPVLDVQDRGTHYSLTAELPGFTKDEVQVKVDSHGLELRAEKMEKEEREGKGGEKGVYRTSSRSYYQYLSLPEQVNAEKIDGTMKNGILELKLPKKVSRLGNDARRVDLK